MRMQDPSERFVQAFDGDMIGTVKHRDLTAHKVRVAFQIADDTTYTGKRLIMSGWLPVLCTTPAIPSTTNPHTESAGDPVHSHALTVNGWFPELNDVVVVRFLPAMNGDGFVYGGLTWH